MPRSLKGRSAHKIHALVGGLCRPIRLMLTAGQAYDGYAAEQMMADLPEELCLHGVMFVTPAGVLLPM